MPPAVINRRAASELLRNPDTLATPLMVILLSAYGDAIFEEDPVVIYANVKDDFRVQMPEELENRFNAAITVMTTDLFFTSPEIFTAIAGAFCDGDIGDIVEGTFDESTIREATGFDTVTAPEMMWAINEAGILRGEDDLLPLFSPSVKSYVEGAMLSEVESTDEVDPETDTMQEAAKDPYYMRYVGEMNQDLKEQLLSLGVPLDTLREIMSV